MKIEIVFRNGDMCHYDQDEYTDYKYDGKYFIVIRDKQWVGFYNLECVEYIEVQEEAEEEEYVPLYRKMELGAYEHISVPVSEVEKALKDGWEVIKE